MQQGTKSSNSGPLGMIAVGVIVASVMTALAAWTGKNFWFPQEASTIAPTVDWLFNLITWISIFFFVLIITLMVWFVIKYRMRSHEKATSDITHNTPLELTWTIIPLILVIAIFYAGMEGYLHIRRAPLGAYEVNVTAQRWSWEFSHRNGCTETNHLLIPLGRPVRMVMQSKDVLHAFYIPEFRIKQDIVPGRITDLWFEATKPGIFDLYCAEYCGKDHSQMHAVVEVLPEEEFQAKVKECADIWDRTNPEDFPKLAREKIYPQCVSCHSLDGKAGTGPTWRGLWEEVQKGNVVFSDGSTLKDHMGPGKEFPTPEDYIRDSILNPQNKIVMNFTGAMPTFKGQLTGNKLTAIIEFIKHLEEFDEKGNPKNASAPAP